MNSILSAIVPWWGKLAALCVLVAVIWGHGYTTGGSRAEQRYEALRTKEQAAALATVQRLAKVASEISVHWVRATNTIHERARITTKEVPKYVTAKADSGCLVTSGFVRLWDESADLQANLYQPAAGDFDAPAGLALSDVAREVVEARRRFEFNRATLMACQDWVRSTRQTE